MEKIRDMLASGDPEMLLLGLQLALRNGKGWCYKYMRKNICLPYEKTIKLYTLDDSCYYISVYGDMFYASKVFTETYYSMTTSRYPITKIYVDGEDNRHAKKQ